MGKKQTHFRRCHVCGTTSEHAKWVDRCAKCNKVFAPYFYYDEESVEAITEHLQRAPRMLGEYAPIIGISTVWWTTK
ncbi:MAG: hypothetical protein KDD37_11700 [Bdellovibrionales bacterium]|nr:hypothetical protein [Bdellovibrionales bacterium]